MKAIFLDRDGVINKDPGGWTKYDYVTNWEEFNFLPGALEALKLLKDNNIKVLVISNQAGVGKGHFSKADLDKLTARMKKEVENAGGTVEEVFYCLHRSDEDCDCRKPKSGLLEKAGKKYGVDFKKTYFVGDTEGDVVAGKKAGCRTAVVLSGKASLKDVEKWEERPDFVFKDLLEAVNYLLEKGRVG